MTGAESSQEGVGQTQVIAEPATRAGDDQPAALPGPATGVAKSSIVQRHPIGVAVTTGVAGLVLGEIAAAALLLLWTPEPAPVACEFPPAPAGAWAGPPPPFGWGPPPPPPGAWGLPNQPPPPGVPAPRWTPGAPSPTPTEPPPPSR